MAKYVCGICGYIYDEDVGIPGAGIKPGTKFETLPDDWKCPLCGAPKASFVRQEEPQKDIKKPDIVTYHEPHEMKELSYAQMSALCSNLSKGCEKQYLTEESGLFAKLAEFYRIKAGTVGNSSIQDIGEKLEEDLSAAFKNANAIAADAKDRGALRVLTWSEKVTRMIQSILARYEKEKDEMLNHTNIYVCEICGFIYIGDTPPDICPVCKVPNKKLTKIERGE